MMVTTEGEQSRAGSGNVVNANNNILVLVIGDVNVDVHIRVPEDRYTENLWKADKDKAYVSLAWGSAGMLGSLIRSLSQADDSITVLAPQPPEDPPLDGSLDVLVQTWTNLKRHNGIERPSGWRQDLALGWMHPDDWNANEVRRQQAKKARELTDGLFSQLNDSSASAHIVIIDDKRFGFRHRQDVWTRVTRQATRWVVLRMARPVFDREEIEHGVNHLWRTLPDSDRNWKLVVIITAHDLFDANLATVQDYSWDMLVQSTASALARCDSTVTRLRIGDRFIILCGDLGALLFRRDQIALCLEMVVFDPIRTGFTADRKEGRVQGFAYAMIIAIVHDLLGVIRQKPSTDPDWRKMLQRGLRAASMLQEHGFEINSLSQKLQFPNETVIREVRDNSAGKQRYQTVNLPCSPSAAGWSILNCVLESKSDDLTVATQVAIMGLEEVLPEVPRLSIGDLTSLDRHEIEGVRSIKRLIEAYVLTTSGSMPLRTPLSVAVFGPPGSGKSFAVKQIAKAIENSGGERTIMTFNLSQLTGPDQLVGAFHQVRDRIVGGHVPIVFWDEFDTTLHGEPLGWLRYFLAPMEDGEFLHEHVLHTIGRAVFVFAGGTTHRFAQFQRACENLKDAKGPDFVSRLSATLDVVGINRRSEQDNTFQLRRAILLRELLWRTEKRLFNTANMNSPNRRKRDEPLVCDVDLVKRFLDVSEYKNGARSLRMIISCGQWKGKAKFNRAGLPARSILALHLSENDASRFFE